ncbi:poly [ADP-ribose] polymerase 1-like isoform X2 [Dendronephthya gigantea]|uniref:poly [ADP-ribose] polymerase 1-like isoform X2 n=1 Tax=Dendronephthya gigantea TaxID=151771 RepID=UPI00106AE8CB|nr:poly [ADP-ribose] polymerase 1-like isoform X2 [Dendronephthya gigantea]
MRQSSHFDGKIPNWFHYGCFFKKKFGLSNVSEVNGFDSLRWDDQEKIRGKLSGGGSQAGGTSMVDGPAPDDSLAVEYAKSSRSSCKSCEDKFDKGDLRVGKNMEPSPDSTAFGRVSMMMHWFHVDCFVKKRLDLEVEYDVTAEMFPGFSTLTKEDQALLQEKLGTSGTKGKKGGKKRKGSATVEAKVKQNKKMKEEVKEKTENEKEEEEALKAQNKRIWEIRDALKNECTLNDLRDMLAENDQSDFGGESVLLDRCADGMAFGALKRCSECKRGHFNYKNDGYYCSGNITEWTKCTHVTKDPERTAWKISKDLKEESNFLKKFKLKKGKRIFPAVKEAPSTSTISQGKDETDTKPVVVPGKPLSGLTLGIIGKLKTTKAVTKSRIEELGGTLKDKISSEITCCISTPGEVAKNSKKMQSAKEDDIPVVSEDYLKAVEKEGALAAIVNHNLVSWGKKRNGTNSKRTAAIDVADGPPSKKKAGKTTGSGKVVEKKVKMSVKGGAVVDPDSGLEDVAHVLDVKGEVYNAVLGMVDITRGTNSYYKLQVLKKDKSERYYLFRSWGRVGTTIGGNKLEDCGSCSDSAICRFTDMYYEKTGNHWLNRKNFVKQASRFYPLDIDYGQDDDNLQAQTTIAAGSKSTLPLAVQKLVRMIFDIESMKNALLEFEIDLKKMPLGKLSRKQIESAYSILTEAQKLIEDSGSKGSILDASNRFYTLIPHDFGLKKPPLLDNLELIKSKVEMLDNLLDIEVAYSLIKETSDSEDPLDSYYKKLKTHIKPIAKEEEEFVMIEKYVKNTHASTHRHYDLEVEEIFRIERDGEKKRYKPFKKLPNRKLLWHGSRATNFAGILSQGLRIAPPEAPVTGYMFGKGIYFADMVSKSANYCNTSYSNPTGLMLLCEVALGNMHELTAANYIKKLPAGKHSVKGCGRTAPDPSDDHTMDDGTIVPYGNGIDTNVVKSSLLYNEYIVYDVAQVNMKYLLRLKFNYV